MSYQDTIDKKASIRNAKRELEQFSDLLKLNQFSCINIQSINYDSIINIVNCIAMDKIILNNIEKKDEQLVVIKNMFEAIERLKEEEIEIIYSKYILMHSNKHIEKELGMSHSKRARILNNALFSMALILRVEIKK